MCGIAGVFSRDWCETNREMVEKIVASQKCRGPDHEAVETIVDSGGCLVLGHNRLSIIDLSDQANQPMWDGDHRFCLVFNGEIYNYIELRDELSVLGHRFATQSDSEVIIESFKQWGIAALERFNGMFAFALYDTENRSLWLVRDRFGVKPLYYWLDRERLCFASTSQAIAAWAGLQPNLDYLARGLKYRVYEDDGDISAYSGLKALPPACYLQTEISEDGCLKTALNRYYDLSKQVMDIREEICGLSSRKLTERVEEVFKESVVFRLRSDVPLGISLSGGLDSSVLAAFFARFHGDLTGFTYGSPDEPYSEGPAVERFSRKTGIRVYYVQPEMQESVAAFWETLDAQDAPFPGPSIVAQHLVFRAAFANGIKVLLGGQGGDELFMGYRKFQIFHFLELARKKRYLRALGVLVGVFSVLVAEFNRLVDYWSHRGRYLKGTGPESAVRFPEAAPLALGYDSAQPLWHRQVEDVTRFSLPTLLRYEDRNSMGNSVESRLPFLDYRLVELAMALPSAAKVHKGFGKWILRELGKGRVPDEIRMARYKRPFDVNQRAWIEGGLGGSIRRGLLEHRKKIGDFLMNGENIETAFSDFQLCRRPSALPEAITLVWLGDRIR